MGLVNRALRPAVAVLIAGLVSMGTPRAAEPEVVFEHEGDPVFRVLPPGRIPAISDPKFLKGEAADAQMTPTEPVLGVVSGGEAKAYSLWQLDAHEIVNDRLEGRPITASW